MGFFKKKKGDFVDLGERYRKQKERADNIRESLKEDPVEVPSDSQSSGGMFGIFGGANVASTTNSYSQESSDYTDLSKSHNSSDGSMEDVNDRRKKLTKRILDMTEKIEDLSNQIYRLQQRVEVLERKSGSRGY